MVHRKRTDRLSQMKMMEIRRKHFLKASHERRDRVVLFYRIKTIGVGESK